MKRYLFLFCLSMVPVIELRGAVPLGLGWGLPFWPVFAFSVLGNILIIPFVVFFGEKVLSHAADWPLIGKFCSWQLRRVRKKAGTITGAWLVGLYAFVAVPLPGTGAWTGSLIAAVLDIPLKRAFWPIAAGVLTAGVIMAAGSFGVLSLVG